MEFVSIDTIDKKLMYAIDKSHCWRRNKYKYQLCTMRILQRCFGGRQGTEWSTRIIKTIGSLECYIC